MTERARAKINLTLHVGRIIADPSDAFYGYHPLDSLVVFAEAADVLSARAALETALHVTGPFGAGLDADDGNLILKAYNAVAAAGDIPPMTFTLTKNLPVASGIGGGSADAAAALRILKVHADLADEKWHDIAVHLGADVPVCVLSQTAHMSGIGEDLRPWPGLGTRHAVLVNPGVAISTGDIFKAFDKGMPRETPRPQLASGDLLTRARDGRNDLQPAAIESASIIQDAIDLLAAQDGCDLARMSGSGATCFGLFKDETSAAVAAQMIAAKHPDWWVVSTVLGGG